MTGSIPFINLPLQYANLKEETLNAVDTVLSSGVLLDGPQKLTLQRKLIARTGFKHAIITHSGTVALQIIARYFKVKQHLSSPMVAIPAVSFAASANAFHNEGYLVHFVDVDEYGMGITPYNIPDVYLPVGLYGNPSVCPKYGNSVTKVVEDGCQSWLAKQNTKTTAVSFDPMKNLPSIGNGGAILTNDSDLASFAEQYCNHGKYNGKFVGAGSNLRMSEVECAILNVKLNHIDYWQQRRKEIAQYFIDEFKDCAVTTLIDSSNIDNHGMQKFVVRTDRRDSLAKMLRDEGIETKVHYETPLPDLPQFSQYSKPKTRNYETFCKSVLSLPFYPELTDAEVEKIAESVKQLV